MESGALGLARLRGSLSSNAKSLSAQPQPLQEQAARAPARLVTAAPPAPSHHPHGFPVPSPQSYGGGRDIVGLGDSTLLKGQQFTQAPIFDDGYIEVGGQEVVAVWGLD